MGAYEFQSTVDFCVCVAGDGILYVNAAATGFDNGTFRPLGAVSGQEALSIIRKLKADL